MSQQSQVKSMIHPEGYKFNEPTLQAAVYSENQPGLYRTLFQTLLKTGNQRSQDTMHWLLGHKLVMRMKENCHHWPLKPHSMSAHSHSDSGTGYAVISIGKLGVQNTL